MRCHTTYAGMLAPFLLLASAPLGVLAGDVLQTSGFASCLNHDSDLKVNKLDISFDRSTKKVKFDVAGVNNKKQFVMATLIVNAYGREVYRNSFDPCAENTKVAQLCPGMFPLPSRACFRLLTCYQYHQLLSRHRESRLFPTNTSHRSPPSHSTSLTLTARQPWN